MPVFTAPDTVREEPLKVPPVNVSADTSVVKTPLTPLMSAVVVMSPPASIVLVVVTVPAWSTIKEGALIVPPTPVPGAQEPLS